MARTLTTDQRNLLRSDSIQMRVLFTVYLDGGTYRYCDDVVDVVDSVSAGGPYTFIGASALAEISEFKSGSNLAAESITITVDGNKIPAGAGVDPAAVLREIQSALYTQRRTKIQLGLSYPGQPIILVMPVHSGKINHTQLTEPGHDLTSDEERPPQARLEIVIDSLALRYSRKTNRTRSHADQLELDATDDFFKFTVDAVLSERSLYWGKKDPNIGGAFSVLGITFYDPYVGQAWGTQPPPPTQNGN
jgi:hypothetical protein